MIDTSSLLVFITAALVLLLTPGPAVFFIVARSIEQGTRAGLVSTLGMVIGGIAHVAAAVLGISALLMSSVLAFSIVKYAGAAYLIYLGIKTLRSASDAAVIATSTPQPLSRIFGEAVAVQVLNPKAALFFFAFLPQFVQPEKGSPTAQVFGLGVLYLALALVTDSMYAVIAGKLSAHIKQRPGMLRTQRRIAGVTYIGLGVMTAAAGHRK